jgi:hypothetical protein
MALTQITEKGIKDGEIINADINASAAIAGTKIAPDFGSQQIIIGNDIKSATDDPFIYSYKGGSDGQVRSGLQLDGTNQRMEFYTGTNERMRIDSSGNVGIGSRTTSPDNLLHVHTASNDAVVHIEGAADGKVRLRAHNGQSIVQFADSASSTVGELVYDHGSDYLKFHVNASERMRIDTSGRVLIGTTSTGTANSYSDNLVVSEASGDAGISIHGNNSNSNYSSLYLGDAGAASRAYLEAQLGANGNFTIGASGTGPMRFLNNGAERMRIDGSGVVDINTTGTVNTGDRLVVMSPSGSHTVTSLTVDANNHTGTHANALIYTKSKNTYWNGYAFQSSHGYIGALLGKRDSAGTSDQEIRMEIGGDGPNNNEEKTWTFRNNGNLALSGGNVELASGNGIDFSATSNSGGSMTSELLDDYEEGTFTPTNTIGMTLTNNHTARYTKIGRMVYIQMDLSFSGASDASQCGIIQSLPFTSMGSSHYTQGAIQFISDSNGTYLDEDDNNTLLFVGPSESSIDIWNLNGGYRQTRGYLNGRRFRISMWYTAT